MAGDVEVGESVSVALLVIPERLSSLERAVFVLGESFALPYTQTTGFLNYSEAAVRPARRAHEYVRECQLCFEGDRRAQR